MATEKNISSRIIHKHDIEANWNKAVNFTPKAGEIIVYDKDENYNYERFKIGDGETAVAALPFGSIQSDWNQNDETALDYVKNRTHWVEQSEGEEIIHKLDGKFLPEGTPWIECVEGEVVPSCILTVNEEAGQADFDAPFILVAGKTYTVTYNNVQYECVALADEVDGYSTFLLGNYGAIFDGISTGEPFVIASIPADEMAVIIPLDGSTEVTISINGPVITCHKLQEVLMPDSANIYFKKGSSNGSMRHVQSQPEHNNYVIGEYSFAEGIYTEASGRSSHAEGWSSTASGDYSHAEGWASTASGHSSHAEGSSTTASGNSSHTEGYFTDASGDDSHAEGNNTTASGGYSHAEGVNTIASGNHSHAEGFITTASGNSSHAEGINTKASGLSSHTEGTNTIAYGNYSHVEGDYAVASGIGSHAEGGGAVAFGAYAHAEGNGHPERIYVTGEAGATTYTYSTEKVGVLLSEGYIVCCREVCAKIESVDKVNQTITLDKSLSNDILNEVSAYYYNLVASGTNSHTEGSGTKASGNSSHAEGSYTIASGDCSHAEGNSTVASRSFSHAEGHLSHASGHISHAEGYNTIASGDYSHTEGSNTSAIGWYSHAEGGSTTASGNYSHAEGRHTTAFSKYQHVQGKYNIDDTNDLYAHIVGNGDDDGDYSNAHTLDWEGNAWFAGDVYVGSASGKNKDEGSKKLITADELTNYYTKPEVEQFHDEIKDYVDDEVAALVNAAPETLDTLGELAAAFAENKEVVDALDASITNKQDKVSDALILVDTITGKQHKIQIQNGQLVSFEIE